MATTGRPVEVLKLVGIKDSSGTALASGRCRFYQPGTLIAETVYSDAALSSAISQPLVLNAHGQGTVYTKEPCRMVVKDSTDSTTVYDDVVNLVRADHVYVTNTAVNGGAETTLDDIIDDFTAQYQWMDQSTATERDFDIVIGERMVSVKDFGAVGDGSTDDTTAIQNAVNSSGDIVLFPAGTYKITSAITIASDVPKSIRGVGRDGSIIKSFANVNVLSITADSTGDYKIHVCDLSISSNAGSTAGGIYIPTAAGAVVERVNVTGHASGIYITGDNCTVRDCNVTYTGTLAANFGIYNPNGSVRDCKTTGPATGGSDSGIQAAEAQRCVASTSPTGFQLGTNGSLRVSAIDCVASNCATGFNVATNVDMVNLVNCDATGSTTDLIVGSGVTNLSIQGGSFLTSTISATSYAPSLRMIPVAGSSASTPATFTPVFTTGSVYQTFTGSYTAGAQAVTVAAPTNTAYIPTGTIVFLHFIKTGANAMNLTWDAQYIDGDGSTFSGVTSVASNTEVTIMFRKIAAGNYQRVMVGAATAI